MSITRLIQYFKKELSNAEWEGNNDVAELLRRKLDILEFKLSIGETTDEDF